MLSVLSSYLDQTPTPTLHPFLLFCLCFALPGNLQHGHQYFCCSNGQKKNKVERRRKPVCRTLRCCCSVAFSACPHPSIPAPPVYAPPLPLNCNLLPFGWLLLPRHWGSSCSTSATAARINGRQLKQITFIVITPHVSATPLSLSLCLPPLLLALIYLAFCLCDS